jgi:hypothetical protein
MAASGPAGNAAKDAAGSATGYKPFPNTSVQNIMFPCRARPFGVAKATCMSICCTLVCDHCTEHTRRNEQQTSQTLEEKKGIAVPHPGASGEYKHTGRRDLLKELCV